MRQPEEMAFYAVKTEDGLVAGCHAVRERAPANAVEISEDDYRVLCSAKRHDRAENEGMPHVIVALAESEKQQVHNIIAAIVEETTFDHREEISALDAEVKRKFSEYDAMFGAIRNELGKFKDEG